MTSFTCQSVYCSLCLILLLFTSTTSRAEFSRGLHYKPRTEASRFEQRKMYRDAVYFIKTGQRSRFRKLKDKLRTYPLYPYLDYTDRIYHLSRQTPASIQQFVEEYQDTPLATQLLQNWFFNLAKRGQWKTFLEHYDPAIEGERNACFYAYALFRENRLTDAMARAEKLWLVDFSQPDECDPVFKVWREHDGLTPEIAWKRYSLAIRGNQLKLASYLTRFLTREDKQLANTFKQVHSRPLAVRNNRKLSRDNEKIREIILHGVRRLARSRPDEAFDTLARYESTHRFNTDALEQAWVYIGRHLAASGDGKNRIERIPVDIRAHPELIEARIRLALREGQWSDVLVLINLLPADRQQENSWRYWKARVLDFSPDPADRGSARDLYRNLAKDRSFYGFLSADRLEQAYNFAVESPPVTAEEVLALEETPGIQRALELLTLDERNRARREWYFTTRNFSVREQQIAARVAWKWGWYKPAIQSLIDAQAWNDLDYRFPVAYRDTFIHNARSADIPVNWSLAIARQESAFMPDARSPVGAWGLMQLMPATARLVAEQSGASFRSNRELTRPELNIKLGSHYLGRMLRRYHNNRILASAAYNAGPGNVDRWLDPGLPLDVWIETIPFLETRNYVQNVLMFSAIYARQLGQTEPLIYANELADFSEHPGGIIAGLDADRTTEETPVRVN